MGQPGETARVNGSRARLVANESLAQRCLLLSRGLAHGQVVVPLQELSPKFTPPVTVALELFEITFSR
jgi:hypothetical protein